MSEIQTVKLVEDSFLVNGSMSVSADAGNRHYQEILDWINEGNTPEGADIIEPDYVALRTGEDGYASIAEQMDMQFKADGSWEAHIASVKEAFPKTLVGGVTLAPVPQALLDAAATKLFAKQLADYNQATSRLAQYRLADGRPELTEMQDLGDGDWNIETGEWEPVLVEVVVQTAIEPLEPTVEQTVYSDDMDAEPTVEVVPNPLIVADDAERAEAQAVIDDTPVAVTEAAQPEG